MYARSITRTHRTAFVVAIDGSGSMAEPIRFRGRSATKAEAVAEVAQKKKLGEDKTFELMESDFQAYTEKHHQSTAKRFEGRVPTTYDSAYTTEYQL